MEPQTARVIWTAKDVIRHKITGKPYLVKHVWIDIATDVIDLEAAIDPQPTVTILPRSYSYYALDRDFTLKGHELCYEPIQV